jgi:hypothetical protein
MVIERIDEEKIVMTFDNKIDAFSIQRLIDFARYLEAMADKVNGFDGSINEDDDEITPLVKSLCGVIKLPKDFDYKTEYGSHLLEKYK